MKNQEMSSKRQRGTQNPPIIKLVLLGSEGVGKSGEFGLICNSIYSTLIKLKISHSDL